MSDGGSAFTSNLVPWLEFLPSVLFRRQRAEATGFDASGAEVSETRASFGRSELSMRVDRSLAKSGDERFDVVYPRTSWNTFWIFSGASARSSSDSSKAVCA